MPIHLERPDLLSRLINASDPVVALSAPRGYGKTTLLNTYQRHLQNTNQPVVSVLCLTDDQRAAHLAAALVRRISGVIPGLFEGILSEYQALKSTAATLLLNTPDTLAQAVAFDLNQSPIPLTIIIDGLIGTEQLQFILELTRRSDVGHRFILSGYEPLLAQLNLTNIPYQALTKTELAFTPEECRALNAEWGEHRGWPAAVINLAAAGHQQLGDYLHGLISLLGNDERELLPAALLEVWFDPAPTPGAVALGLTGRWVERFRRLGWPLLNTVTGEGIQPHPLLRDAMLAALASWGDLESASARLAQALSTTAPIRSIELQPDTVARLITVRRELPGWVNEGQWTLILTHLEPHIDHLEPAELSHYARACLNLASSVEELTARFPALKQLQRLGASEPQISLVIAETHLRLGHIDAAITVLNTAKNRLRGSEAQLAVLGFQALVQYQAGRAREVLIELQGYSQLQLSRYPEAAVAKAAASLAAGDVDKSISGALRAHLTYLYQPALIAQHLNAVFVLVDLLTDLGRFSDAEQLLSQVPTHHTNQGWLAIRRSLSAALLSFRQNHRPDAQRNYQDAAHRSRLGGHTDLGITAEIGLLYLAFQSGDPVQARSHAQTITRLSRTGMSSSTLLYRLDVALQAYTSHPDTVQALVKQLSTQDPHETTFLAATRLREQGRPIALNLDLYGLGLWKTWLPRAETANASAPTHHLSIALLQEHPLLLLNGRALAITPKQKAVLAYLALQQQVTRDQLRRDLFQDSSSPSTYIHKSLSVIKRSIEDIIGEGQQGVLLSQQHQQHYTYALHERLTLSMDVHEIMTCPLDRIVMLFKAPLNLAQSEVWFGSLLNHVRDVLELRLRAAAWSDAQPALQHLMRVDNGDHRWANLPAQDDPHLIPLVPPGNASN